MVAHIVCDFGIDNDSKRLHFELFSLFETMSNACSTRKSNNFLRKSEFTTNMLQAWNRFFISFRGELGNENLSRDKNLLAT